MFFRKLWSRLAIFARHRDLEREIDGELQFHLDMESAAIARAGMTPDQARLAARLSLGAPDATREAIRDQRTTWLDSVWRDTVHGVRSLRRSPAYATAVLLTVAVGIGATTSTYSIVYSLLFRPLPLPHSERIVVVMGRSLKTGQVYSSITKESFAALRASGAFEAIAAHDYLGSQLTMPGAAGPETFAAAEVSSDYFTVVGVQPSIGRAFTDEECRPGAGKVVVLSHGFWRRRLAGDPHVVGRPLPFSSGERVVIGIMPEGFWSPRLRALSDPDLLIPSEISWDDPRAGQQSFLTLLARLRPGVSVEEAQAAADVVATRLARSAFPVDADRGLAVRSLRAEMGRYPRPTLLLLQGAALFLLLTAAANTANLTLARGRARAAELAVRSTLGASRWRVVRQLTTETLLLDLAGGLAGIALSWWIVQIAVASLPRILRTVPAIGIDGHVLVVSTLVTVSVGLVSGLVPAISATRRDVMSGLQPIHRRQPGGRRPIRGLQAGLLAAEAALVVALLAGTGLVVNSLARVTTTRLGFGYDLDRLARVRLTLAPNQQASHRALAELVDRTMPLLQAIPGVEAATCMSPTPLSGEASGGHFLGSTEPVPIEVRHITVGSLESLGMRLVRGRLFRESDQLPHPEVGVVNEAFVRALLGTGDAVGSVLALRLSGERTQRTVIGVVGDVKDRSLLVEPSPTLYTLFDAVSRAMQREVLVRTDRPAEQLSGPIEQTLRTAGIGAVPIETLDGARSRRFNTERYYSLVVIGFGGTGLVLVVVGIGGVVAESVVRRTREIGVRVAIGARPACVVRLVVRQVAGPLGFGLAAGTAMALAIGRFIGGVLFEVRPTDPATLAAVAATVVLTALAAAWVPARRAARLDPVEALKTE